MTSDPAEETGGYNEPDYPWFVFAGAQFIIGMDHPLIVLGKDGHVHKITATTVFLDDLTPDEFNTVHKYRVNLQRRRRDDEQGD